MIIAGVDEVGRGPWAGPVVTAAVILPEGFDISLLNDSKKMRKAAREKARDEILRCAVFAYGAASRAEIDRLNIRIATHLAMCRAVARLAKRPDFVEIDGRDIPAELDLPARAVIGGDGLLPHISAASIIAKELRDTLMVKLALRYPGFAWEKNAGYGTKAHQGGLAKIGITPHHRRSFKPIKLLTERS